MSVDDIALVSEFAGGESFVVPRSFSGTWETVEPSRKIFVAIDTGASPE
jgi:uncharacterized cupin superfamily protein